MQLTNTVIQMSTKFNIAVSLAQGLGRAYQCRNLTGAWEQFVSINDQWELNPGLLDTSSSP